MPCFDFAVNRVKLSLARLCELTGLNSLSLAGLNTLAGSHIRAINYHDVPASQTEAFERQLCYYARHYVPVDYAGLRAFLDGTWNSAKPGLIISFDDGLRSHAEVAAPLLEHYGFIGWFFVPLGFIETPVAEQATYARSHRIQYIDEFPDGRVAMSLEEVRRLAHRHVVGCHTHSHVRLRADVSPDALRHEITGAKHHLEDILGGEIPVFCWVGGEEASYSHAAAQWIHRSGFRHSFMTNSAIILPSSDPLQLQRTNIEAHYPLSLVRFQLSGFLDMLYTGKRRRVNRLTAIDM